MEFGVPSKKRVAKEEKYPNTAVLTLLPYAGENTSRKIEFNKKASEVLGFNKDEVNKVAFSFNRSDLSQNSVVNANELGSDAALNVAKNGNLSNKSHYVELKQRFGEAPESELELTILDTGNKFEGVTIFSLVKLSSLKEAMNTELEDETQTLEASEEEEEDITDSLIGELQKEEEEEIPNYLADDNDEVDSLATVDGADDDDDSDLPF